ncbi:MAG: hypothetical protein IPL32_15260 [Chloracidobacterium sp.]|nr:hypothetical protein [Chloracidobacterium sp.]
MAGHLFLAFWAFLVTSSTSGRFIRTPSRICWTVYYLQFIKWLEHFGLELTLLLAKVVTGAVVAIGVTANDGIDRCARTAETDKSSDERHANFTSRRRTCWATPLRI